MASNSARFLEKFVSNDGAQTYTFPTAALEYDPQAPLRGATAVVVGGDFSHDYAGLAPWAKDNAREVCRFLITGSVSATALDTVVDSLKANLYRAGLGKLYTVGADASERWAWARLTNLPQAKVSNLSWKHAPVSLDFLRESDWYATSTTTGTNTVTVGQSPKTVTINNPGNARVKGAAALLITVTALAAGGYASGFSLYNQTTGQTFATSRPSTSTSSRVQIDTQRESVKYSTDAGVTYLDDYASVTIAATQVALFELDPGNNTVIITVPGTPNVQFDWQFFAPWF